MPADYYADAAPAAEPKSEASPQESGGDSNVATLPKSVLGGKEFKPGEEVVLKVVQVMEDSVLVEYASEGEEQDEKGEQPEEAMPPQQAPPPGGGGMASMME